MKFNFPDYSRTLFAADGITGVSVTAIGSPAPVTITDSTLNAWTSLAYTPDSPTTTIGWDGNPDTQGVGTITPSYRVWRGSNINGGVRHLRVWARRKAGATGAIRAQTITLQGIDSGYVTVDKLTIGATTAGTDEPATSVVDILRANTFDPRLSFGTANPFKFVSSLSTITGGGIEADDNVYTKTGHGLITGDAVSLTSLTGGTGLTAGNLYYFHRLTDDTGYLCSSAANAAAGTAINVTLDASSVVLTPVDTNIEICVEMVGIAS